MTNRFFVASVVLLASTMFIGTSASAQTEAPPVQAQTCEFFRFGRPTMDVYALGAVKQNCRWKLETDIKFIDFLTIISPPGLGVTETIDTTPVVMMQIYRTGPSGSIKVYDASVESILMAETPMPILRDGDVVVLKQEAKKKRRYITFQNFTAVLGTFSTSLLLYLRLKDGSAR